MDDWIVKGGRLLIALMRSVVVIYAVLFPKDVEKIAIGDREGPLGKDRTHEDRKPASQLVSGSPEEAKPSPKPP